MTNIQVLTPNGRIYVEHLSYKTNQEACDATLVLLEKGYGVNLSVDENLNVHTIADHDISPFTL